MKAPLHSAALIVGPAFSAIRSVQRVITFRGAKPGRLL